MCLQCQEVSVPPVSGVASSSVRGSSDLKCLEVSVPQVRRSIEQKCQEASVPASSVRRSSELDCQEASVPPKRHYNTVQYSAFH